MKNIEKGTYMATKPAPAKPQPAKPAGRSNTSLFITSYEYMSVYSNTDMFL